MHNGGERYRQDQMRDNLEKRMIAQRLFYHASSQMENYAMTLYRGGMARTYEDTKRLACQILGPKTAQVLQQQLRSMGAGSDLTVTCP